MLRVSVTSALLAIVGALLALYELTNIWWAVLALAAVLAAVAVLAGFAADAAAPQPQPQREQEVR